MEDIEDTWRHEKMGGPMDNKNKDIEYLKAKILFILVWSFYSINHKYFVEISF
jgi:hypothetical protein